MERTPRSPKALIIENEEYSLGKLIDYARKAGFETDGVRSGTAALEYLHGQADRLDLLVVDLHLEVSNQGWSIIAEIKQKLPYWCQIIIVTGDQSTGPAASSVPVAFFHKGGMEVKRLRESFALQAQSCAARLHGNDPRSPEVDTQAFDGQLDYRALMMCRAITDAKRVEVRRKLSGSFQEGAVLHVYLTPRDNAPSCFAVVKCGDLEKVKKEIEGQAKLMWYWDRIGESLPPLRQYPSLLSSQELVLVTPFAKGETLSRIIVDRWYGNEGRVGTFKGIFSAAKQFLEQIQRRNPCEHGLGFTFERHYNGASQGKDDTIKALQGLIGTNAAEVLVCSESGVRIPNPLLLFSGGSPTGWHWRASPAFCRAVTYGHGDFHAGNLLVDLDEGGAVKPGGLTVLDYDRVCECCCYFDPAQLESSFLLELALAFDDHLPEAKWKEYFLPALKVLTSARAEVTIDDKKFASELVSVVKHLRGGLSENDQMLYYGALLTTLLRVSKSHYLKAQRQQPPTDLSRSAQRTIVITLGLLLNQLIEWDDGFEMTTREVAL